VGPWRRQLKQHHWGMNNIRPPEFKWKNLNDLKSEISLMEYAPNYDYTELDRNQSSRTCVVLRRQADDGKIAVSRGHDGHWVYYDFRRGKGGSILDFVMQHTGCNLGQTRKELRKALCCNIDSFSHTAPLPNPRSAAKNRQKSGVGVRWHHADYKTYMITWKVEVLVLNPFWPVGLPTS